MKVLTSVHVEIAMPNETHQKGCSVPVLRLQMHSLAMLPPSAYKVGLCPCCYSDALRDSFRLVLARCRVVAFSSNYVKPGVISWTTVIRHGGAGLRVVRSRRFVGLSRQVVGGILPLHWPAVTIQCTFIAFNDRSSQYPQNIHLSFYLTEADLFSCLFVTIPIISLGFEKASIFVRCMDGRFFVENDCRPNRRNYCNLFFGSSISVGYWNFMTLVVLLAVLIKENDGYPVVWPRYISSGT